MNLEYDYLFKILLIGDSGVGKTAMLSKFVDEEFIHNHISTIGVDFKIKTIDLDNNIIKLQIWDTVGQERFRTITSSYYRGTHGVFIIFDLTDLDSYNNIAKWLDEIYQNCIGVQIFIIGTKADLHDKRVVTQNMIDLIKQKFNYIEISALTGKNISQAFYELSYQIKNSTIGNFTKNKLNNINLQEIKPIKSSNCC
jgi:Ras-related protein Rab-1A